MCPRFVVVDLYDSAPPLKRRASYQMLKTILVTRNIAGSYQSLGQFDMMQMEPGNI